jgi:hypothetical protein
MPATTDALIMMYVDTANIGSYYPQTPANTNNVLDCVYIASNHTDSGSPSESPGAPGGKTTFITDLKSDSQIAWVGAVQSITTWPNDYVLISGIALNNDGIGITLRCKFGGGKNPNQSGSGNTHIDGVVKNNPGGTGSITDYTITFTVCHNGNVMDGFQVDPKLIMK